MADRKLADHGDTFEAYQQEPPESYRMSDILGSLGMLFLVCLAVGLIGWGLEELGVIDKKSPRPVWREIPQLDDF